MLQLASEDAHFPRGGSASSPACPYPCAPVVFPLAAISLSGSPNITMSLADAERQNAGVFAAAGCTQTEAQVNRWLLYAILAELVCRT
jgi:hypothetical protein